jgi:hypothetical protein
MSKTAQRKRTKGQQARAVARAVFRGKAYRSPGRILAFPYHDELRRLRFRETYGIAPPAVWNYGNTGQ